MTAVAAPEGTAAPVSGPRARFRLSSFPSGRGRGVSYFIGASLAAHLVMAGAAWRSFRAGSGEPPIVAELDLSMSLLAPMDRAGGGGKPAQQWFLAKKGRTAPAPVSVAAAEAPKTAEEVQTQDERACAGDNCTGVGTGSGAGVGAGTGGVIDAADAARKPRWVGNFISSADYPLLARQQGKDGRVVLSVIIDETGRVRDARLLQGAYEPLNEVALRKVRQARFTPAYDANKRPVSCKVTLPIRFELK